MPQVSGGWEHTRAVDRLLHTTRLPNSPTVCTNRVAGRMATISKIGWLPNSSSCAATRNCKHQRIQAMKSWWLCSNERIVYVDHKTAVDVGVFDVRHDRA